MPIALAGVAAAAVQDRLGDDPPPPAGSAAAPVLVTLDRDDLVLGADLAPGTEVLVRTTGLPIEDDEHDGILRIEGPGLVVRFEGDGLRGGPVGEDPDRRTGIGIVVAADDVRLVDPVVRGVRTAILARGADRLEIDGADLADLYRPRLGSTPRAEDPADWLRPHENDADEWLDRYGAAVWIEEATGVRLVRVRVRESQHGIVLDACAEATVLGCDASFLSGWGLALWRTSRSVIVDNAFDFCIRGYSHEVYNRGQDSAGILMFEQCEGNVIAFNSCTHGGDGIFAFSGRQALGESPLPEGVDNARGFGWYEGRGHRDHLIVGNDLSFAAAHGLELTFSFASGIAGNVFEGNAITGIWGGYSQDLLIAGNRFLANGDMPYGLERGGINIEHGRGHRIVDNEFAGNAVGVRLWWDEDEGLRRLPWVQANGAAATDTVVSRNRFRGDEVALELERHGRTWWNGNGIFDVEEELRLDEASARGLVLDPPPPPGPVVTEVLRRLQHPRFREMPTLIGAVGGRPALRGREHVVMTEWGPWNHERPLVQAETTGNGYRTWRLRGARGDEGELALEVEADDGIAWTREGDLVRARSETPGRIRLRVRDGAGRTAEASGFLLPMRWTVRAFAWTVDPREDLDAFRAAAADGGVPEAVIEGSLGLDFANGGPSQVRALRDTPIEAAALPANGFGTVARTTLALPAGRWRVRTRSDDGIRVVVNGAAILEDWTHHAPRAADAIFEVAAADAAAGGAAPVEIVVEHFELDGYAVLEVALEPAD